MSRQPLLQAEPTEEEPEELEQGGQGGQGWNPGTGGPLSVFPGRLQPLLLQETPRECPPPCPAGPVLDHVDLAQAPQSTIARYYRLLMVYIT